MSNQPVEIDAAFEEFLRTRRDHREGLTARQQLWTAFEAGAKWALWNVSRGMQGDAVEEISGD